MKAVSIAVVICVTLLLVFFVLPQYGIRTLPGTVEYLSEPEPETVAYVARPPAQVGEKLLSPWAADTEEVWTETQRKWVLWKGEVHSIEPAFNPNRIVFVYEHDAPRPFSKRPFGVVVHFDPAWTGALERLSPGDTVYYRGKLADREFALVAGRHDLPVDSYLLELEDGQLIDSDDITTGLVELAYAGYHQLDLLLLLAEQTAIVTDYFERRLELDWSKIQVIDRALPISIPDKAGEASDEVLTPIRSIKTDAEARIETNLALALEYLHDSPRDHEENLGEFMEAKQRTHSNLVANNHRAAQELWEAYELQRQAPGLKDLAKGVVGLIPGIGEIIAAVWDIQEIMGLYHDLNEAGKVVSSCYILLGAITDAMVQIGGNSADAAALALD